MMSYIVYAAILFAGINVHKSIASRNAKGCGQPPNLVTPYIIGGHLAHSGEFPWQAAFFYKNSSGAISYGCGGTLISNQWILTAGHCVGATLHHIRLGDLYTNATPSSGAVERAVQNQIPHPGFQNYPSQLKWDLGLIYLNESVEFTDTIYPICLPHTDEVYDYTDVVVSGWGFTVPYEPTLPPKGGGYSFELKKASVSLTPHYLCKQNYAKCPGNAANDVLSVDGPGAPEISERVICAIGSDGGSCTGDSGGPLMFRHPDNGTWYLGGVVSFNCGCGDPKWPGGFTRVTSYIDWIDEVTDVLPPRRNK